MSNTYDAFFDNGTKEYCLLRHEQLVRVED
jgi:hypothetical protein